MRRVHFLLDWGAARKGQLRWLQLIMACEAVDWVAIMTLFVCILYVLCRMLFFCSGPVLRQRKLGGLSRKAVPPPQG